MLPLAVVALIASACGPAAPGTGVPGAPGAPGGERPGRTKALVIGISNAVDVMPPTGSNTTSGGWQSVNELWAQGLVTSDRDDRRPVPRLATQVPSFQAGSLSILPDGRMRTVYPLRNDVTWHDGVRFTAQDLVFSFEFNTDRNLPKLSAETLNRMESVEAPDDYTFVIYWKAPYYQADSVGLRAFWPHPRHILEQPYRTLDPQGVINLPYWTGPDHVHLGPFRLAEFRAGEELTFTAYDKYFLGRPKVDRVIVRVYNDENVLYSAVLADAIDLLMDNSLSGDLGLQLKDQWERPGKGQVHLGTGTTRFVAPQFDPQFQQEPAVLDPRVRQALAFALDRRSISEVVQYGHGELVANSLLPPGDRLFDAVKDSFAQYVHDPGRARSLLSQAGWNPGADGILLGPGGRRFNTTLWSTQGNDREIAVIADSWRQVGVSAEQFVIPGALVRDREARSKYPGFETSAAGYGDAMIARFDSRLSAVPPNYSGTNRGHYLNSRMDQLIDSYLGSVEQREQERVIRALAEVVAEDLPVTLLYFNPTTASVRKGVKALDDYKGAAEGAQAYGTFTRNAHEWDIEL